MNEKLNIQDLIEMLAERHGMSRKDADSFMKEFFQLIEESLEKDKYVKIRGLGTFKLINVGSRESVNVNTGERFRIEGHTKVSFTPEPTLKDIINRPFSHFETVVLNDGTVLEDTPLENDGEEEENVTETAAGEPVAGSELAVEPEPAIEPEPMAEVEEGKPEIPERMVEAESEEETPEQPEPVTKDTADFSSLKYFIGFVILVVLLCGGAITFMYCPDLLDGIIAKPLTEEVADLEADKSDAEETNVVTGKAGIALQDSIASKEGTGAARRDTVAEAVVKTASVPEEAPKKDAQPQPQSPPAPKKERKKTATPFKPDSVGYTIVGTETTYTIKEGETLTRVALRFYGTKALWPYIVKHNPGVIKNPNNVPYGTTIKIPKLKKKQ